jgi:hypothetical protein
VRVLSELRAQLIADGLVRDPDQAGALPPLWLAPPLGLNAPNEGSQPSYRSPLQIGADVAPGIPPAAREGFLRRDAVDFTFRAMRAPAVIDMWEALYHHLVDRVNWQMGALLVSEIGVTQTLQPLAEDEQGFRYRAQILVTWQDFEQAAARGWGA